MDENTVSGSTSRLTPTSGVANPSPAGLLARWQASGNPEHLADIVAAVRPLVEFFAAGVLRSHGIVDRSAVDDVVSLVFDHLRRLPRCCSEERTVAMFRAERPEADDGVAYLRLLSRQRALDVVRHRHRRSRHALPLSMVDRDVRRSLTLPQASASPADEADLHMRLVDAIDRLEPRLRTVVELLLNGKSQAAIARILGVCEGTVSRARSQAVADLRQLMEP